MAEALPIIGAVASALVWANNARTFVESIRGAPDVVKHLLTDLVAIETPLRELCNLIEASHLDATTRSQLGPILNPALDHCRKVSQDVQDALRPYVKPDQTPDSTVWKKMSFTFKAAKIKSLGDDLARCKATLTMALNVSNILIQARQADQTLTIDQTTQRSNRILTRLQRHFDIETSSHAGSEVAGDLHTFRRDIKHWITQTETVDEEDEGLKEAAWDFPDTAITAGRSEIDPVSERWLITGPDKEKFDHTFASVDTRGKGFLNGQEAMHFFRNARVPDEVLKRIWSLADWNSDGKLNRDEFAVAMYLIRQYRGSRDFQVPLVLPWNLVPPSMRRSKASVQQPTLSRANAVRTVREEPLIDFA